MPDWIQSSTGIDRRLRVAGDILEEDRPAERRADEQRAGGHDLRGGLADPAADQPGDDRGEQRQEDDAGSRCISRASG